MTIPRRRLIRPAIVSAPTDPQRPRQLQKLRQRLDHERTALARWQTKLKRAFNTVQRCQQSIGRLERKIAHLEN
jgi:septal ring factor EnvC (AmiA/AmiB activator)